MVKITHVSMATMIAMITLVAGCATTRSANVVEYPAVTPNPAVATHPDIVETSYDYSNDTRNTAEINTYFPTGVGLNVNGYGPGVANYYEAGFFGNF